MVEERACALGPASIVCRRMRSAEISTDDPGTLSNLLDSPSDVTGKKHSLLPIGDRAFFIEAVEIDRYINSFAVKCLGKVGKNFPPITRGNARPALLRRST